MTKEPLSPDEQRKANPPPVTPSTKTETMLAEIIRKIDKYHAEDIKRSEKDRNRNTGYIAFGFALATTGLITIQVITAIKIFFAIMAVILWILGSLSISHSRRFI